jgi:hypothetical protein
MGAAPDSFQGWGRIFLKASIPLPGVSDANVRLQVADRMVLEKTGSVVTLRGLRATGTGYATGLGVTEAWLLPLLAFYGPAGWLGLGSWPHKGTTW